MISAIIKCRFVVLGVIVFLVGCTITPSAIQARKISFDGNQQTAGFIGFTSEGEGIISPAALERYNGLILRYGTNFIPPLLPDAGVSLTPSNAFIIDAEHLIKFGTMNYWRRNGLR